MKTIEITQICPCCGKEFTSWVSKKCVKLQYKYCSEECKEKYLNEIYPKKIGGYCKGSGRGKSGWYKGIHCDSSWELAFVVYHIDNNLKIERCKEQRKYIFNGEEHVYIPDFITDEGIIEIKGYSSVQWKEKEYQNNDIKVLYKEDIIFYLNYVIKKYGSDFINLYDNSKPKKDYLNNLTKWIHKYEDNVYYTMVINPKDIDKYLTDGWLLGRGKIYNGFIRKHIKTKNIFIR